MSAGPAGGGQAHFIFPDMRMTRFRTRADLRVINLFTLWESITGTTLAITTIVFPNLMLRTTVVNLIVLVSIRAAVGAF